MQSPHLCWFLSLSSTNPGGSGPPVQADFGVQCPVYASSTHVGYNLFLTKPPPGRCPLHAKRSASPGLLALPLPTLLSRPHSQLPGSGSGSPR